MAMSGEPVHEPILGVAQGAANAILEKAVVVWDRFATVPARAPFASRRTAHLVSQCRDQISE
jgi:hypothetical protein